MAAGFEVTAAMPTQELDASQRLVDVMILSGRTIPHSVVFSVTVPKVSGWRDAALAAAAAEAAELESLFDA